jgi:hypothetical protein
MSMVIDAAGRVLVRDAGNDRMSIFDLDGELLDTWPLPGGFSTSRASIAAPDGTIYLPRSVGRDPDTRMPIVGMMPHDIDGEAAGEAESPPDPGYEQPHFPTIVQQSEGGGRRTITMEVPFYPRPVAVMSPLGEWVVGVGTAYRFEVRHRDGSVTVVERRVDPVPIGSAEASWRRDATTRSARNYDPQWSWSGPDIPDHKPYFDALIPDHSGRVWVRRTGPSVYYDECPPVPGAPARDPDEEPRPCWRGEVIHDLFGADGRYLGEVDLPGNYRFFGDAFVRGDLVLLPWEDEFGTLMVKRFRLVPPEG